MIPRPHTFVFTLILLVLLVLPASAGYVWVNTTVDTDGVSTFTSLAFNVSTNTPAISYYDSGNSALKYAWYDGSVWVKETVDSEGLDGPVGKGNSLVFNGSYPAISYYCGYAGNTFLKYAWYDGSSWSTTTIDDAGSVGEYTSLAFNGSYPAISYYNATNSALKYAWYDGSEWQNTTVDGGGTDSVGQYTSLAFNGSTNTPAISYFDFNTALKYAWYDGSEWQNRTVDSDVLYGQSSLAFDNFDYPAISYRDSSYALNYAYYDGSTWDIKTVDSGSSINFAFCSSLAFNGSTNTPAISYYDDGNSALKYAWYDGSWVTTTVDTDCTYQHTSLAFDNGGYPAISYYNATGTALKYASYVPTGSINVSSDPDGAWIWLDGVNTSEQTNTTLTDIPVGEHQVTVQKALYAIPANTIVTVTKDATSSTDFILVALPPTASFTADTTLGLVPFLVHFTDTSSGMSGTRSWNFGDGATSTVQNPEHTYINPGTYTVTLTVENEGGTDTKVQHDFIRAVLPPSSSDSDDSAPLPVVADTGTLLTSSEGKVLRDTTFISDDSIAALTFPQGTVALDGNGKALDRILIETVNASAIPPLPDTEMFRFAGYAYTCSPSGATFTPPITLTFTLSEDEWNALNGDFSVRFYDEEAGVWVDIPVNVDTVSHTVTAEVSHFSVFALFEETADETEAVVTGETAAPTVVTPSPTTTATSATTPPAPTPASPLIVVPMIALGALALLKKRQ